MFAKFRKPLLLAVAMVTVCAVRPALAKKAKYRTITASMKRSTVLWSQPRNNKGYPAGCGPCAWAIVLDHWNLLGRTKLLNNGKTKTMWEIAKDVRTKHKSYKGVKFGRTMPANMLDVKKYIARRGYSSSVDRVKGTEFAKFQKVKKELERNRPVVLLISDPKKPFGTLHYVVIEKAELQQKRGLTKWKDHRVRYLVNWGSGKTKWICVREVGINKQKHTHSFSMFFLRVN